MRPLKNSKGSVYYGMHFYPGVAEYKELGNIRVFLNESTIRNMGPTFAGRPVYVQHVDDVPTRLDDVKAEADGWVSESFFNEADGKHWVKFLVCSERGEKAIGSGYRLSNCYTPKEFGDPGEWNGVTYQKEIKGGEYDHLALVPNPRYEESVVMTPDQFKAYNERQREELKKLANDNGGSRTMFFKKAKVENSADIESMVVVLPKSGREISIKTLVNEADVAEEKKAKKEPQMANDDDMVNVGDKKMSVKELCNGYLEMGDSSKHEAVNPDMHNEDDEGKEDDAVENEDDDDDMENAEDEDDASEDKDVKSKAKAVVDHEEKEIDDAKKKKSNAKVDPRIKEKADRVRNAPAKGNHEDYAPSTRVHDPFGSVERGRARYGS